MATITSTGSNNISPARRPAEPERGRLAYELGVSEATIKAHVSAILQKLGVESRTRAVIAAATIAGGQWRPRA
jgi:hypothetical protein